MPWRPAAAGARPGKLFGTPEHRLLVLQSLWPHVVGPAVAENSAVAAIRGDVMTVRVTDARWRRALHRMHRDIIVRLRDRVGHLAPARLGFLEGGVQGAMPRVVEPPAAAEPPPPRAVTEAAAAIGDPELRASFLRTAGRYLGNTRDGRRGGGKGHA